MNPGLEKEADEIIKRHQGDKSGIFEWTGYLAEKGKIEGAYSLAINARDILIEKQLIRFFIQSEHHITQLTIKGWRWESFEAEQNLVEKEKKEERKIKWPQRNWLLIGIITYIFGIFSNIILEIFKQKNSYAPPEKNSILSKDTLKRKDTTSFNTSR